MKLHYKGKYDENVDSLPSGELEKHKNAVKFKEINEIKKIMIIMNIFAGISLSLKKAIEKKFKNRTLTLLSLMYIGACVFVGVISSLWTDQIIIPIILIMYAIQKICVSMWFILEPKYLKNFTKEDTRNKLTFAYEFTGAIVASFFSILGGMLLNVLNVKNAFLVIGLLGLVSIIITLNYMKTRFGLNPEEYTVEDIEF